MTKITKRDIDNIREFARSSYVKTASEWTSGSGRYTSRRATPIFTTEFQRSDFSRELETGKNLPQWGTLERKAYNYFSENPRTRTILVMDFEAILQVLHGAETK
jgi:hypothetical protein